MDRGAGWKSMSEGRLRELSDREEKGGSSLLAGRTSWTVSVALYCEDWSLSSILIDMGEVGGRHRE